MSNHANCDASDYEKLNQSQSKRQWGFHFEAL